ncbi:MAG: hypothetical protein CL778_05280 [Chloroflexi bacterium]|nr:hypothetical protein [Chloroflexota bacterium]
MVGGRRNQCTDCINERRREKAKKRLDNESRTCFHCEETKLLREFINPNGIVRRGGRRGTRPSCNNCVESGVEHLRCRRCKELKLKSDFYVSPTNGSIGYKSHCKECETLYFREYKEKNPERHKELSREREIRSYKKNVPRYWSRRLFHGAKERSKKLGITPSISQEFILNKIEENNRQCEVTNLPFIPSAYNEGAGRGQHYKNAFVPSLDRINPEHGYTPTNTRVVVNIFNVARGKAKDEHLLRLSRKILIPESGEPNKIEIKGSDMTLDRYVQRKITDAKARSKGWRKFFDLDTDWFHEQIKDGRCSVTGIPYEIILGTSGTTTENDWSPSLDKIDPEGGYRKDNCRVVVTLYNRAKGIWTDEELKKLATALCSTSGFA